MNGESQDIRQIRLQRLKEISPELFAESQLDWEKLKAAFGEDINFANERYVLNWAGKSDAFKILQQPTTVTLKPAPEESYLTPGPSPEREGSNSWNDFINSPTQHLFIEGENLEVLKVLQKAYYGKVKCIIIDPPYNTGSDSFIYPDKFSEKKEDYLKRIGDKDEEGYLMKEGLFRKNSKDSGHYHSNWLSMMYPRLFLAKNLLRDDGVIFVHIDDNEVHNLRMAMNEIFGEENFVAQISVQSNPRGRQAEKYFATVHEYLIVYSKNINLCSIVGAVLSEDQIKDFKFEDDKGKYRLLGLRQRGAASRRVDRPLMYFPIYVDPKTNKVSLEKNKEYHIEVFPKKSNGEDGRWMWSSKKVAADINSIEARLISHRNEYDVFVRDYLEKEGDERYRKVNTIWVDKEVNNQNGTVELKTLFDDKKFFDFPKPTGTAKKILSVVDVDDDDIILDFFGGSGTTAQAVIELNKKDGGNRKFILVQMPEPCDENSEAYKAGYKTIADIGKERIRRVIQKITSPPAPLLKERGEEVPYAQELFKGAGTALFGNARSMRKEKTEAEDKLWQALRNKQIENCKFRRQHPIGQFIADFYCHEGNLVVEVDGGYHNEMDQKAYDEARTQVINEFGVKVIRFTNKEILGSLPEVLNKITSYLAPLSFRRGAGGEVGFKVFKLSPSSFKIWRGSEIDNEEKLTEQLDAFTNPIKPGAEKQNMLYELMLKAGHELTSKVEYILPRPLGEGRGEGFYSINNNVLIIVLDVINEKLIEQIMSAKPQKVITLDSLFTENDQLKTNTVLQMRDAGVDFKTV